MQNVILNYEQSQDYNTVKSWLEHFEIKIFNLTEAWNDFWNKHVQPSQSIDSLEIELKKNIAGANYCKDILRARLPGRSAFETQLLKTYANAA